MHSNLSPHLHSPECNELIRLLLACHKENPVGRFVGFCNKQDALMVACLKREREINRSLNAEKSKLKREEVQRRLQENTSS
ncbi:hypothetical protein OUZ56_013432 [Daphnia magna]|uniref:COX assembly mitochondrial protein n=1 Tax=Daphnia magna TaxID=35525 RepID=A0ABQ9Z5V7_9CRUS|nr:hypothetical protein OUZ56_013432 [Daphnia magna]